MRIQNPPFPTVHNCKTLGSELKLASGVSSPSDPHPSPLVHYWVMVITLVTRTM